MNLWEMLGSLMVASVSSFGNGTVMAAVLQRSFVQDARVLTNDQLLFAFALARVTPGQSNLYIASIGYMMFGWAGSILSMLAIALPSYLMLPMLSGYQRLRRISAVPRFTRGLASTAVGILIATSWSLSKDSLNPPVTWVVLGVALGLMVFTKLPTIVSLALATAAGVAIVVTVPAAAGSALL
jgi:chromate transporter